MPPISTIKKLKKIFFMLTTHTSGGKPTPAGFVKDIQNTGNLCKINLHVNWWSIKQHLNTLKQDCKNPGYQVTQATKICTTVHSVCGSSVWGLHLITLLVPRILRWLLDSWKICIPLSQKIVLNLPVISNMFWPVLIHHQGNNSYKTWRIFSWDVTPRRHPFQENSSPINGENFWRISSFLNNTLQFLNSQLSSYSVSRSSFSLSFQCHEHRMSSLSLHCAFCSLIN